MSLETDYRNILPSLKTLESEVTHQLETILNQSGVTLAIPIEHRVKSLPERTRPVGKIVESYDIPQRSS